MVPAVPPLRNCLLLRAKHIVFSVLSETQFVFDENNEIIHTDRQTTMSQQHTCSSVVSYHTAW